MKVRAIKDVLTNGPSMYVGQVGHFLSKVNGEPQKEAFGQINEIIMTEKTTTLVVERDDGSIAKLKV